MMADPIVMTSLFGRKPSFTFAPLTRAPWTGVGAGAVHTATRSIRDRGTG